MPLCTTKRRTTKNLKIKKQPELPENRTVWKSDNQGVKEKHSSRLVGEEEMGSQVKRTHGKAADGRPGEAAAGRLGSPTFT